MNKFNLVLIVALLQSSLALADDMNSAAAEVEQVQGVVIDKIVVDAGKADVESSFVHGVQIEETQVEDRKIQGTQVRGVRVNPYAYADD